MLRANSTKSCVKQVVATESILTLTHQHPTHGIQIVFVDEKESIHLGFHHMSAKRDQSHASLSGAESEGSLGSGAAKDSSTERRRKQPRQTLEYGDSEQEEVAGSEIAEKTSDNALHAHFDCFSGAAGDMLLASCIDAAGDDDRDGFVHKIATAIRSGMPELDGEFEIAVHRVWRGAGSISAIHVVVKSVYDHEPAPVPRAGSSLTTTSGTRDDGHDHHHEHSHSHDLGHHSHEHSERMTTTDTGRGNSPGRSPGQRRPLRNLPQIRNMLMRAPEEFIPSWVRETAILVFSEIAMAEAAVHGANDKDAVHFHEVGAVDSIVDTVGTLLALHFLGVKSITCSRLPMGEGAVRTAHGILPVPAPATMCLLIGMPTTPGPPGVTGELITPTGVALLRVLTTQTKIPGITPGRAPRFTLRTVGVGAGTKNFRNHPNIVRLFLGDSVVKPSPKLPAVRLEK